MTTVTSHPDCSGSHMAAVNPGSVNMTGLGNYIIFAYCPECGENQLVMDGRLIAHRQAPSVRTIDPQPEQPEMAPKGRTRPTLRELATGKAGTR
jgi:hypothetical protein